MGEVALTGADGRAVTDPSFVKEAGGFTFFGDSCLEAITRCAYTVSAAPTLLLLSAPPSCRRLHGVVLGAPLSGHHVQDSG